VRKLLLHEREIRKLFDLSKVKGHVLIPLSLYWKNRKVKVAVAVCRGKRQFDKREAIKRRETDQQLKRAAMHRLKGRWR
jgi:SsrA-binding protein